MKQTKQSSSEIDRVVDFLNAQNLHFSDPWLQHLKLTFSTYTSTQTGLLNMFSNEVVYDVVCTVQGSLFNFGTHFVRAPRDGETYIGVLEKQFMSDTGYDQFAVPHFESFEPPYALKVFLDYQHRCARSKQNKE